MSLLEIAMTKKNFVFKNYFFFQTKGVAMGARFAPDVANLYMDSYTYMELSVLFPVTSPSGSGTSMMSS